MLKQKAGGEIAEYVRSHRYGDKNADAPLRKIEALVHQGRHEAHYGKMLHGVHAEDNGEHQGTTRAEDLFISRRVPCDPLLVAETPRLATAAMKTARSTSRMALASHTDRQV